jgi:hypothetical protein
MQPSEPFVRARCILRRLDDARRDGIDPGATGGVVDRKETGGRGEAALRERREDRRCAGVGVLGDSRRNADASSQAGERGAPFLGEELRFLPAVAPGATPVVSLVVTLGDE